MSTDRLGELRAQALPSILQYLAEHDGAKSQAELTEQANEAFDRALTNARVIHKQRLNEDPDAHLEYLVASFKETAGILPLVSVQLIKEFVLPDKFKIPA